LESALAGFRSTILAAVLMSEQCWYCGCERHQTRTLSHTTAARAGSGTCSIRWSSSISRQRQVAQLGTFLVSSQEKQNDQSDKCESSCTTNHAAGNSSSRRRVVIAIVGVRWGASGRDAIRSGGCAIARDAGKSNTIGIIGRTLG
jgi:hypothetical protein